MWEEEGDTALQLTFVGKGPDIFVQDCRMTRLSNLIYHRRSCCLVCFYRILCQDVCPRELSVLRSCFVCSCLAEISSLMQIVLMHCEGALYPQIEDVYQVTIKVYF